MNDRRWRDPPSSEQLQTRLLDRHRPRRIGVRGLRQTTDEHVRLHRQYCFMDEIATRRRDHRRTNEPAAAEMTDPGVRGREARVASSANPFDRVAFVLDCAPEPVCRASTARVPSTLSLGSIVISSARSIELCVPANSSKRAAWIRFTEGTDAIDQTSPRWAHSQSLDGRRDHGQICRVEERGDVDPDRRDSRCFVADGSNGHQ